MPGLLTPGIDPRLVPSAPQAAPTTVVPRNDPVVEIAKQRAKEKGVKLPIVQQPDEAPQPQIKVGPSKEQRRQQQRLTQPADPESARLLREPEPAERAPEAATRPSSKPKPKSGRAVGKIVGKEDPLTKLAAGTEGEQNDLLAKLKETAVRKRAEKKAKDESARKPDGEIDWARYQENLGNSDPFTRFMVDPLSFMAGRAPAWTAPRDFAPDLSEVFKDIPGQVEGMVEEVDPNSWTNFDWSDAVVDFMNSDDPYAQAYLRSNGIDPGKFDWGTDYGDLANEGGRDVWSNMIRSSPNMMRAYIDDYGDLIDRDADGSVSKKEADSWYDRMKEENVVDDLDWTDTDDEIMQRIFGGIGGRGMDNDLVDAIQMLDTMDAVRAVYQNPGVDLGTLFSNYPASTPYASDTDDFMINTVGILKDMSEEGFDAESPEFNDKVARVNNALKLDRLISEADENRRSGEKRTVIDFGDDADDYADQYVGLWNNVAGGDAGIRFGNDSRFVDPSTLQIYDVPTAGGYGSSAVDVANAVVNSGGKDISDDLVYLMTENLGTGRGRSLSQSGKKAYRSTGKKDSAKPVEVTSPSILGENRRFRYMPLPEEYAERVGRARY